MKKRFILNGLMVYYMDRNRLFFQKFFFGWYHAIIQLDVA
jgi:hypothetical protein